MSSGVRPNGGVSDGRDSRSAWPDLEGEGLVVGGKGVGLVGVVRVVADEDGGVLGDGAEGAVGLGVGEGDAAEVASEVGTLMGEVEGCLDLTVLEGGVAFGERILLDDVRFEEFGVGDWPVLGQGEGLFALAAAQQERKPGEDGGHGVRF